MYRAYPFNNQCLVQTTAIYGHSSALGGLSERVFLSPCLSVYVYVWPVIYLENFAGRRCLCPAMSHWMEVDLK